MIILNINNYNNNKQKQKREKQGKRKTNKHTNNNTYLLHLDYEKTTLSNMQRKHHVH